MPTQNPKKYLDDEGLETILELLKTKIDQGGGSITPITDKEIAELFDIEDLDQNYVSQEALQEALEETEY